VLQRRLRRGQYAADVDVDHAIHLLQRGLFERFRNGCARIVHKHIQSAEGRDCLFDRGLDSFYVGGVRLDRESLSAFTFNRLTTAEAALLSFAYVMATLAPSLASLFAIAAPTPLDPPVTSATFSFNVDM
jgi:plasmid replication initiation protein